MAAISIWSFAIPAVSTAGGVMPGGAFICIGLFFQFCCACCCHPLRALRPFCHCCVPACDCAHGALHLLHRHLWFQLPPPQAQDHHGIAVLPAAVATTTTTVAQARRDGES
eukprot:12910470-Prorocentrum_lima.AAC.1